MTGRTIDYGLAGNGAEVTRVTAHGKRGSDHRLVVFEVRADRDRFRVGLWNVEHRRNNPRRVARLVCRVVELFDLDALAVLEAQGYRLELRHAAKAAGLKVHQWDDGPGMSHQAIVTHPGRVSTCEAFIKRATRTGWRTARTGIPTDAKYLPTVRIVRPSGAGLRVIAGHRPPTQRWRRGRMTGPRLRVAATIAHARAEVAFLLSRPPHRAYLLVADWNATPDTRGRWSPAWVARVTGSRLAAPDRATHG